ncbi:MAG: aconitate hydratase AcnA [Hydrogenophilales bacterium]
MKIFKDSFKKSIKLHGKNNGYYYSLPELEKKGIGKVSKLPISIRIVLESVLRNQDEKKITKNHVVDLANWKPKEKRSKEIPFVVSRIVLQDFTGVPLLADIAAMRSESVSRNKSPKLIEPLVPVDLVVDHSVQIDKFGYKNSLEDNMKIEFSRNSERYEFIKWGMQAFDTFKVVPPGIGIIHQVNLEYLARGVFKKDNILYPDTLVGTDSHTTMINALGVVGWGVGGIEAEAGMLGQPIYFLTPDVVGVNLTGKLRYGVTATDLVLTITEKLRKLNVVGKFVEFFGNGVSNLSLPDRATIANMAPEYGATMGFFPIDSNTVSFLKDTGKTVQEVVEFENYYKKQNLFGVPKKGQIKYSEEIDIDLTKVEPSLAGPRRPQDRISLGNIKKTFKNYLSKPLSEGGFGINNIESSKNSTEVNHGDILIAAITSCTNTSNPGVLIAAGILAKNAVEKGLKVNPKVKTSLAPGSRVVTDYLTKTNLLPYLEKLGFFVSAYGCTTCIGNAGPLDNKIEQQIIDKNLVCASVLSGNRNFEARIHQNIKANFIASPPLVVAYAIAGNVNINLMEEPLGIDKNNNDVYLGDIWPNEKEVNKNLKLALNPIRFKKLYSNLNNSSELWKQIQTVKGDTYSWPKSSYIAKPPFLEKTLNKQSDSIVNARALAIFGDSVTTDHISPAGAIKIDSPAGKYLQSLGIKPVDFNSYGSRRGNHEIMLRGTFANVRIKNLMLSLAGNGKQIEGGYTIHYPSKQQMTIFEAANKYKSSNTQSIVFAGEEYGTGSSRDWAAKGTKLLGIKAVVAKSFERIHRSNLVGMGVLPLEFMKNESIETLKLKGDELFTISNLDKIRPQQKIAMLIQRSNGEIFSINLNLRIDTAIEIEYYQNGGILPYVLEEIIS